MSCTKVEVANELARVLKVHELPKRYEGWDLATVADTYHEHLHDLSPKALAFGVSTFLREAHPFWPKPGELRSRSLLWHENGNGTTLLERFNRWSSDPFRHARTGNESEPCPVCQAVYVPQPYIRRDGSAGPERMVITHDSTLHREAGIGYAFS